ncbi:hypothetical protein Tco_0569303 [Tanacetum coccineum]
MPSEYQQDYKKTRAYAPKIYNDPNMTNELKNVYRGLESRYVHEGRTINPSFYQDLNDESLAKFINIGFNCLLSLNRKICLRFIMEFYKTLRLDRNLNDNRICLYSDAWPIDHLEKTLEQIPPYNSTLPSLEDIQNLIHRRTVFEKQTKQGMAKKLPNQIETNELLEHLKPYELVIRENVYSAIGNRDYVQAIIALMLYCLESGRSFNLAYFVIMRMYYFRDQSDKVLPYGMILTRLFKNIKSNHTQLTTSSSSDLPPLDNGDLPSTKLSPRSYIRDLPFRENLSVDQRETRGMFKNLAQALHKFAKMLKNGCR